MDDGKFDRNSANTIKNNKKMKNTQDSIQQFEYCKACKLNHNQGRKHIYFPNHKKAFSAFLARFESKLADVRFFLKNPSVLKPEYASQNRVWCVFCDEDIVEIQSKFACDKAIRHLASSDHLKKVKALLWKYGGRMDRVDSYCILETDLMKWEKKCLSLEKTVIAEGRPRPPLIGPVNDIHSELNSNYINSNGITNDYGFYNISNDVLPLQKSTNEKTQASSQVVGNTMGVGSEPHKMHLGNNCQTEICASGHTHSHHSSYSAALNCSGSGKFANRNVYTGDGLASSESSSYGYSDLTRIAPMVLENTNGNVHSGAPPPWFSGAESNCLEKLKPGKSVVTELKKSSKLNPKRVGAAWAERRKIELEQERLGLVDPNNFDSNWLPDFGGVWHSGSRKESRKQFEVKRKDAHNDEIQPERALQLQPYVSKRMLKAPLFFCDHCFLFDFVGSYTFS